MSDIGLTDGEPACVETLEPMGLNCGVFGVVRRLSTYTGYPSATYGGSMCNSVPLPRGPVATSATTLTERVSASTTRPTSTFLRLPAFLVL